MDKHEALKWVIYQVSPNIDTILDRYAKNSRKPINTEFLLKIISQPNYNLKEIGLSAATITKLLKELFPDRIVSSTGDKVCGFILAKFELKWCGRCCQVHEFSNFRKNKALKHGINAYCKECHLETTSSTQSNRQSNYRCALLNRTPSWVDYDEIKKIYDSCPEGMHVDHEYPLQGKLVSGLHVHQNLRHISAHDNLSKGNKFEII